MKKLFLIIILISTIAYSQVPPQGISHRGTVYSTNGTVVASSNVGIQVIILENSATGTEVYKETFTIMTNTFGQYSLNIGQGTPSPPFDNTSFSKINWGTNLKYLKIKIDPTGGTNYNAIVGSNQLMSVPYALYALNSQVRVFNNILELRNATGNTNEVAYIKGHTTPGDCGEGNFIWKALPTGNSGINDNNGTIIRDNSKPFGWIRLIDDKINVKYFGIDFTATDQGNVIQKAIDFATLNALNSIITNTPTNIYFKDITNSGSTVYIPAGEYKIIDKITLKYGVSIEGDGIISTVLKAVNTSQPNGSMVDLDAGQVIGVHVSNIFFDGGVPAGDPTATSTITKHCMYLKAQPTAVFGNTGGLWSSTFKNIKIRNFNGIGILLEGSGINSQSTVADYSSPNQDLIFENVNIARQKNNSNCLLIRGMHGQLTFINCGFDGLQYNMTPTSFDTTKYFNVAIETNAVQAAVIKFLTCTFQYSEYGVFTTYAESVTFDNCWFELLDVSVFASKAAINSNASKCINIANSRFANASGFGSVTVGNKNPSGGSCISVNGGSNVNIQNNYVLVSDINYNNPNNYFIKSGSIDSKINALNNSFQNPSLGKTLGIANNTISITGNSLITFGYKFVTVNCIPTTNTTNNIKELVCDISAGEMITIRATGTTGQHIKFDNTKNIVFAKTATTSFVLLPKETATFMKIDSPITVGSTIYNETYQLISVNKTY